LDATSPGTTGALLSLPGSVAARGQKDFDKPLKGFGPQRDCIPGLPLLFVAPYDDSPV